MKDCSLWITVARTDVHFMMHIIPHLVKMCGHNFMEKILALDTAPLSGEKVLRPNIGSITGLKDNCRRLKEQGTVDKVVDIDYSGKEVARVYNKYFGTSRVSHTHNWKGYPVYGSMWCIEKARGDYFLHFDSDMLLYQQQDFDWVSEGIRMLQEHPEIMYIRPQAGPGHKANNVKKLDNDFNNNTAEFRRLEGFSSRCYLIDRKRFESLLPLKVIWAQRQGRKKDILPRKLIDAYNNLTGTGLLESWEKMVAAAMKSRGFLRADIAGERAWTLHPINHDNGFIKALPGVIDRVEKGDCPAAQAGDYDLKMEHWL